MVLSKEDCFFFLSYSNSYISFNFILVKIELQVNVDDGQLLGADVHHLKILCSKGLRNILRVVLIISFTALNLSIFLLFL